jgi:hypothetical protein
MLVICLCATLSGPHVLAQTAQDKPFSSEELEQIVAPIALYPDTLVAQVLMASTYPLEVVSAARWTKANPGVKDSALQDAMQSQSWDPAVKALVAVPQVLEMMNSKLDWTQKLGDAFLAQQQEVMAAIQGLRLRAESAGNLESGNEQVVVKEQQGSTTVVKIESANPEVIYVPTYNPTVVYGAWPYPAYPPYYYYPPGYVAGATLFTFGVGMAVGAALWGDCDWGRGDVNINTNRYNNFNRTNIQNANWQHRAEHRKGVQYRDSASRERYGRGQVPGADSREAFRGRTEQGRQDIARGDLGTRTASTGARAADGGLGSSRSGGGDFSAGQFSGRDAGAFQGVGRGAETRSYSDRGAASRSASASAGAARAGGAGARAGGGGGGGGGRGGGGGGGRR